MEAEEEFAYVGWDAVGGQFADQDKYREGQGTLNRTGCASSLRSSTASESIIGTELLTRPMIMPAIRPGAVRPRHQQTRQLACAG